jgi:hypothetical protein
VLVFNIKGTDQLKEGMHAMHGREESNTSKTSVLRAPFVCPTFVGMIWCTALKEKALYVVCMHVVRKCLNERQFLSSSDNCFWQSTRTKWSFSPNPSDQESPWLQKCPKWKSAASASLPRQGRWSWAAWASSCPSCRWFLTVTWSRTTSSTWANS